MNGIKILNKKTLTIVTIISFSIVKHAYSVPNAGSLLNFEEEIKKVNILPVQVPDENELINGVSGLNGEKIEVKGFQFDGKKMDLLMSNLQMLEGFNWKKLIF